MLDFARMVAFDAWIGNGDRHQDNWSVLLPEDESRCRLAPMYDPAACLGTELQDGHLQLDPQPRTAQRTSSDTSTNVQVDLATAGRL